MSRIKLISFDLERTLVDSRFSKLIWEEDIPRLYAERHGFSLEDAKDQVLMEYRKVGDGRPEWYDVSYWFRRFGLSADWRELLEIRRNYCHFYPEVQNVIERLAEKFVLIITSNTIRDFLEIQLGELSGFFSKIFSAPSDFGEVKKSPQFYNKICLNTGVNPEFMAHVGDHPQFDYEAPRELGIHAYLLDRSGKTKGDYVVQNLEDFERRIKMLGKGPKP
jgi:putative hydrolase of the HAD superfamily